jgi:hypothetical protein
VQWSPLFKSIYLITHLFDTESGRIHAKCVPVEDILVFSDNRVKLLLLLLGDFNLVNLSFCNNFSRLHPTN